MQQVGLAEHAVQVQVEAGEEVARAEAEARRQDAGVADLVDDGDVRRVAVLVLALEHGDKGDDAAGGAEAAQAREHGDRLRHAREAAAAEEPPSEVRHLDRLDPRGFIGFEIVARDDPAAVCHEREQSLCERAAIDALAPLVREELERTRQAGLLQPPAGTKQRAVRRIDPRARVHRHHGCQHRQAGGVRRREVDAVARQAQRGLDEALPLQPAVRSPEQLEPGGHSGNGARCRAHCVVHELLAERHVEVEQLGRMLPLARAETRHRDEEVEVPGLAGRGVPVDRVPAAEEAGHHCLRDTGGEAGRDRRVRRRAALLEDLPACVRRRRVPGCNASIHGGLLPYSATVVSAARVLPCAARGDDGVHFRGGI